jgi:hypothetical protein
MPPTGHHTRVEFSTTARPPLTTESSLLVLMEITGLLRTLGELPGERKDSSDSLKETLAVSATLPHTPPNDFDHIS